jgi:hypothetical protein
MTTPKVLVALVTCSLPKYEKRAKYCLGSWGKSLPNGFDLKVCTGEALGVGDDYKSLCLKTRAIAAYASTHNYDWLLKVDDDTDIRPNQLTIPVDADYAGWAATDNANPSCPWAHCQGGCYWLSRKAIDIVATAPLGDFLSPEDRWSAEDRWVSRVLRDRDIVPKHLDDYVINPHQDWATLWRPSASYMPQWTVMLQTQEHAS